MLPLLRLFQRLQRTGLRTAPAAWWVVSPASNDRGDDLLTMRTAQRTVTAIVVAEVLGREPGDVTLEIGESQLGRSTGSGGSTTCPSQSPATGRSPLCPYTNW